MWATIPTPTFIPLTPTLTTTLPNPRVATSTVTRRRHPHLTITAASSHENIGGLGKAVLGAIKSSPSTTATNNPGSITPKNVKPKSGKEKTGQELSGSDILWALQKAAAKKTQVSKKQQQKGKGLAVSSLKRENVKRAVDLDKIQPVVVKSDWATRLVDLEKRLQEFLSS